MTTINDPRANRFQAILLKAHIKLMVKGLKNSKLSGTQMLEKVTEITGNKYKQGQYGTAVADLEAFLKENN